MPAYPKNYPFYNWVPKPIGIIILFMFFLPVKMKWLAYLDGARFAFDIIRAIGQHNWAGVVLPVVALLNFAEFIWPEVH